MNSLLLGSKSFSRAQLLKNAHIPFKTIDHYADETKCDWNVSYPDLLKNIAIKKMDHAVLPAGNIGETCFVLTADTMVQDSNGTIHGKPKNKQDAIKSIKAVRGYGTCGTAFCLDKKIWHDGMWHNNERILEYVEAKYEFNMPDAWIEEYLAAVPYYSHISGGVTIEGFGAQFLKCINGSYTTIIGLPMFELRQALEKVYFFD